MNHLTTDILRNGEFFRHYHPARSCFVIALLNSLAFILFSISLMLSPSFLSSIQIRLENALLYWHGMLAASLILLKHSAGIIDPCQARSGVSHTSHWCRIFFRIDGFLNLLGPSASAWARLRPLTKLSFNVFQTLLGQ